MCAEIGCDQRHALLRQVAIEVLAKFVHILARAFCSNAARAGSKIVVEKVGKAWRPYTRHSLQPVKPALGLRHDAGARNDRLSDA